MDDDALLQAGFTRLSLNHRDLLEPYLRTQDVRHSCSTFASLFAWDVTEALWWRIADDCLLLVSSQGGVHLPLFPRGRGDRLGALRSCRALARSSTGAALSVEFLDESERNLFPIVQTHEVYADYVYDTQSIVGLKGNRYASRRSARNALLERYDRVECAPYDLSARDACVDLLRRWSSRSSACGDRLLESKRATETQCVLRVLDNHRALGLVGMTLHVDGALAGFTFGEMLDQETCSILVEKTDRTIKGTSEYIWSEFLRRHWSHAALCNAGDDWGVPSLAWTKRSYHPVRMLPKWSASCPL